MQKLPPEIIDKIYSHTDIETCIRDKKWYALKEWIDSGEVNMHWAAENGHLDLLKYLHLINKERSIVIVDGWVAANGHLEVVKYLHEEVGIMYSPHSIYQAARNGHLEIVKYLHEVVGVEFCPTDAMVLAALNGHLEIVEYLHEVAGAEGDECLIKMTTERNFPEIAKYLESIAK